MENQIYDQISSRTGGDIYIGVVGPVRTGKSTFIKRFMETMVLPDMENPYKRERARDELPQSGTGRTIMTAEPKFVPEEAAEIALPEGGACRVRLVDCVGYLVEGALGGMEGDTPRMVSTPWQEEPMTLAEAAEIGTHKVIGEHSTIGLVVTTDGSFTELPREAYIPAEKRVIEELQSLGKPFLVLVNSSEPNGEAAQRVCDELQSQYRIAPIAVNCLELDESDIADILQQVLYEFPVCEIGFVLPRYIGTLPLHHPVQNSIYQCIRTAAADGEKMRDVQKLCRTLEENEYVERASVDNMALGRGSAVVRVDVPETVFYGIVGEQTGIRCSKTAIRTAAWCARSGISDRLRHCDAVGGGAFARGTGNRSAGRAVWCASAGFCTIHPYDAGQHQSRGQSDRRHGKAVGRTGTLSAQRV